MLNAKAIAEVCTSDSERMHMIGHQGLILAEARSHFMMALITGNPSVAVHSMIDAYTASQVAEVLARSMTSEDGKTLVENLPWNEDRTQVQSWLGRETWPVLERILQRINGMIQSGEFISHGDEPDPDDLVVLEREALELQHAWEQVQRAKLLAQEQDHRKSAADASMSQDDVLSALFDSHTLN